MNILRSLKGFDASSPDTVILTKQKHHFNETEEKQIYRHRRRGIFKQTEILYNWNGGSLVQEQSVEQDYDVCVDLCSLVLVAARKVHLE